MATLADAGRAIFGAITETAGAIEESAATIHSLASTAHAAADLWGENVLESLEFGDEDQDV